ncbi:MAG: 3-deoxy-manno-octulosonate cytidylyltransferase [Gammaproteobacteria bacterium]
MSNDIAIVIPARYASTRFPGKPLAKIGSKTMLEHTCSKALAASQQLNNCPVIVASEDERILTHAEQIAGVTSIITPVDCPTGSDRSLAALKALDIKPRIVINLQGDAPLTPSEYLTAIAQPLLDDRNIAVATPVIQLPWEALDTLRTNKKQTPFTGTSAVLDQNNNAIWFSKNILPAIRNEDKLRTHMPLSPVYQHVGLYGYQYDALAQFVTLPESHYEKLEGLEQLRLLENGFTIRAVKVVSQGYSAGIDTPKDIERAEKYL